MPAVNTTSIPGETFRLYLSTLTNLENPPWMSYGVPFEVSTAFHAEHTCGSERVYVLASGSLSRDIDAISRLRPALGNCWVGYYAGTAPQTPWDQVMAATAEARALRANCIVTVRRGSLIDGAKAILLFLANDINTAEQVSEFHVKCPASRGRAFLHSSEIPMIAPKDVVLICVSTTLSGGEYSSFTGGTDPTTKLKSVMGHPRCSPRLIVLDPKLSINAPRWVWLSTGVRAIDHCVEAFSAHTSQMSQPMQRLYKHTTRLHLDFYARSYSAMPGASHGIGHQLGPLDVGRGQTSCILLPSVMEWVHQASGGKQKILKEAIWTSKPVVEVLRSRGLKESTNNVGDALGAIFREMGMPRSLKEVGVGRDEFEMLAQNSLKGPLCITNPISMTRKDLVLEVLIMCAE